MTEVVTGQAALNNIIIQTDIKNLSIAPATSHLANTEVELAQAEGRFVRLRQALASLAGYDYVIIDSPPSLSLLTVNGLIAAQYVLLPVQAEFYARRGAGATDGDDEVGSQGAQSASALARRGDHHG